MLNVAMAPCGLVFQSGGARGGYFRRRGTISIRPKDGIEMSTTETDNRYRPMLRAEPSLSCTTVANLK